MSRKNGSLLLRPATLLVIGLATAATLFQTVCVGVPIPIPGPTWIVGDPSDLDDCHWGAWGQLICN